MGIESSRPAKSTEYFKMVDDSSQTIGISHHSTGLGKLKVVDKDSGTEYGVPISDINSQSLSSWRIDKK